MGIERLDKVGSKQQKHRSGVIACQDVLLNDDQLRAKCRSKNLLT